MTDERSVYPVKLGVWVNWSHGRVLGSTVTVSRRDGALIIAFTAFFVTIVGTQIWSIFCFFLHRLLSTPSSQDVLHNQRQVVLRNSAGPIGAVFLLVKTALAWSRSEVQACPWRRLLPLIIGTVVMALALAASSGLSSRIVRGNEVLIDGSGCGMVHIPLTEATAHIKGGVSYNARIIEQAADYAQRCYESSAMTNDCKSFIRGALPISKITNAKCPFDESLCLSQDSNIMLDTGLIDSRRDFGLNWAERSEFRLQHQLHCAPLATEGFRRKFTFDNKTYARYQYGDGSRAGSGCNCSFAVNTDAVDILTGYYSPFLEQVPESSLLPIFAMFSKGSLVKDKSSFEPIPELSRHNGDLQIIALLPGNLQFTTRSQDLWYRASTPVRRSQQLGEQSGGAVEVDMYEADEPALPLGCVQKYQICMHGKCSGLVSRDDMLDFLQDELAVQLEFYGPRSFLQTWLSLHNMALVLGRKALASRYSNSGGIQPGPRPNEWHLDVEHWLATSLAFYQLQLADIASGPSLPENSNLEQFVKTPFANETEQVCLSQKIRSTAYTSFSMFWLLFVYVAGALVILVSISLESMARQTPKWLRPKSAGYQDIEWRANHVLHLQRLIHDEETSVQWQRGRFDIPITSAELNLAVVEADGLDSLPLLSRAKQGTSLDDDAKEKHGYSTVVEHISPTSSRDSEEAASVSMVVEDSEEPSTGQALSGRPADDDDNTALGSHPRRGSLIMAPGIAETTRGISSSTANGSHPGRGEGEPRAECHR